MIGTRPVPAPGGGFDTEVALSVPLTQPHLAVTERHGTHVLDMRAEVAVYNRPNIVIRGVDETSHWDFRFYTMAFSYSGLLMYIRSGATVDLSGVSLTDGGGIKPCLVCARLGQKFLPIIDISAGATASIHHSVIVPNIGVGIKGSTGTYTQNVVYRPVTGFWMQHDAHVIENVVFSAKDAVFITNSGEEQSVDLESTGDAEGGTPKACFSTDGSASGTLRNNACGGGVLCAPRLLPNAHCMDSSQPLE